jgi:hypothetical protein
LTEYVARIGEDEWILVIDGKSRKKWTIGKTKSWGWITLGWIKQREGGVVWMDGCVSG